MSDFYIKNLKTDDIVTELQRIGFDNEYCYHVSDKFRYRNIKIYNLTPAQANIIKQTALAVGADLATHRDVITGKQELSDAILCGSFSQIKKISEKLKFQPFKLKKLGELIEKSLEPVSRNTKLAGILNITPDSFSDGGKYFNPKDACKKLIDLIQDGADIIDIGAESTRPGAQAVEPSVQIERLTPVMEFIQKENIKTPISIDTRSSEVADFALNNRASIINDVSGLEYDKNLAKIIAQYKAGVIIQHSQGTPDMMQDSPMYKDVVEEIYFSLKNKAEYAESMGITNIIIDPGIGFGKTRENNYEILNRITEFYSMELPVMVGVSRKSLLGVEGNDNELKDILSGVVSYPLIKSGVDYLRVHNVKLHKTILSHLF